MDATILFPSDFFTLNEPNDSFVEEVEAVESIDGLEAAFFNFDDFIDGEPLKLNRDQMDLPSLLIYRGWMMHPEQYQRFHEELTLKGFDPLTPPSSYELMHIYPWAAEMFDDQTPRYLAFPQTDGRVSIDVERVNETFDRFMVKDYVKSLKDADFPSMIETPITQEELDELVIRFIEMRGELFTGGVMLKEFVDLKRYDGCTNEWREFQFGRGGSLSLCRNSGQPDTAPEPPWLYLNTRDAIICSFYTVDYAELEDGSWTIIEAGDGQVSGLAASDDPMRFYERMRYLLDIL